VSNNSGPGFVASGAGNITWVGIDTANPDALLNVMNSVACVNTNLDLRSAHTAQATTYDDSDSTLYWRSPCLSMFLLTWLITELIRRVSVARGAVIKSTVTVLIENHAIVSVLIFLIKAINRNTTTTTTILRSSVSSSSASTLRLSKSMMQSMREMTGYGDTNGGPTTILGLSVAKQRYHQALNVLISTISSLSSSLSFQSSRRVQSWNDLVVSTLQRSIEEINELEGVGMVPTAPDPAAVISTNITNHNRKSGIPTFQKRSTMTKRGGSDENNKGHREDAEGKQGSISKNGASIDLSSSTNTQSQQWRISSPVCWYRHTPTHW
jgi:hypothetical protein